MSILSFANFTELSMEFPNANCLPFSSKLTGIFYQIILSHTLGRGPNESMIKIQISLDIKH